MMSRHVKSITARLSLRAPQAQSLEILDRVMEIAQPQRLKKAGGSDLKSALDTIRSEFATVEDFDHAFPSLCFALATGVGKTRLMGAFITYLHLEFGIRHFFVLAPNLTIYNKLVADFTPNTPKYVFQGIAEFAVKSPYVVTGETYERTELLLKTDPYDVTIFIFNIAKFNVRNDDGRKTRRLSEYLGTSFMDHLAGLDDLVLIMDEAHRYRADSSAKSIEDLKPLLGLELTATPQIEAGAKSARFRNVVYDYPLARAMADGYVKEPAVATRKNLDPKAISKDALELVKLEDGVRIHESVKVDLEVYAHQSGARRVKPFMLVIAENTEHASELVKLIEGESFFDGRYKGRVIQVHSGQKGAEKDENVERLLSVERADEPTEIVVHVNMLKEGWDVTNLYTIVPLRAADSRTLVEQSIGRGLRLPYGKRTGVTAVDRLTIVAHDRFDEIVEEAKKGGFSFSTIDVGTAIPDRGTHTIVVPPTFETAIGIAEAVPIVTQSNPAGTLAARPCFTSPDEIAAARATAQALAKVARDRQLVPTPKALESAAVQKKLADAVRNALSAGQLPTTPDESTLTDERLSWIVREATTAYNSLTIAIPRVLVDHGGAARAGFHDFSLDLSALRLQPVAEELLVKHLNRESRETIGALVGGLTEARLEDYVVRGLIDFDDISYDDHAELLYALAASVVTHFRSYLKNDDEVRNVLIFHSKKIAELVHTQMQPHAWEERSSFEVVVNQGFFYLAAQAFAAPVGEVVRNYDSPVENKRDIRQMLFGGFKKCLYSIQKFDVDAERRFAILLEEDESVTKWFKPGRGVLAISYKHGYKDGEYNPDFIVETQTDKLLCEVKRADELQDSEVTAKASAAATWCKHATSHEIGNDGKSWRYLLIPHDAVAGNVSIDWLASQFAFTVPDK